MKKFERNATYKLYRQNGDDAIRTALVTGIDGKRNKVRFEIDNKQIIADVVIGADNKMYTRMEAGNQYLEICAEDIIVK